MVYHRPVGVVRTRRLMGIKPGRRTTPVPSNGGRITVVLNTDGPTAGFGGEGTVPAEAGVSVGDTIIIKREKLITKVTLQLVQERSITRPLVRGPGVNLILISPLPTMAQTSFAIKGPDLFTRVARPRTTVVVSTDFIMTVGPRRG